MFDELQSEWRRLRGKRPGRRFTQRFEEKHRFAHSTARKIIVVTAGLIMIAIGIFLLAMPGPGMLFLLIGAGLIAEESLTVARFLDSAEVRLRRLYAASLHNWKRASTALKVIAIVCALLIATGLAIGAYSLAFA